MTQLSLSTTMVVFTDIGDLIKLAWLNSILQRWLPQTLYFYYRRCFLDYEDDDQIRFFEVFSECEKSTISTFLFIAVKHEMANLVLERVPQHLHTCILIIHSALGHMAERLSMHEEKILIAKLEDIWLPLAATNTHGSLAQVNGQWYIFYHRSINNDGGYS